MKIKSAEFIGAIGQIGQAQPDEARGLLQVAFAGRSNVGKSSLVNRLLGRTRSPVARVSQHPGKTQEINFYRVETTLGAFVLVDLPGYGYAKVPMALKERWQPLIRGYITNSRELAGIVQLIDIRHGPTNDDHGSIEFLASHALPALLILTKADKLNKTGRESATATIREQLAADPDQLIIFSAKTGEGREQLLEALGGLLDGHESRVASREDTV